MKSSYFLSSLLLAMTLPNTPSFAAETSTMDNTCQSQVLLPALFHPSTENITVYEASTRYSTTPVQMGYGERKVKVADAYVIYETVPATFSEVTETIEVERERVEVTTLPATYRTETKRIKVKDATQRWNPICPAVATNEQAVPAHCLLSVPAEYTEVTREVVDMPARTVKTIIPAPTETITRKVVVQPAKVIRKEIPAEYRMVKLAKVDQAPKVTSTQQNARAQAIPSQQTLRPERIIQRPALCEATVNPATILKLQQRLQQGGYYQGTPDGVLGPKTRAALTHFQEDNQLASGAITLEALQKLQLQ
ncbi:peptidoglycan-binding domain-containing protein [Thiothrix lacustris]|uniref:Peptidoglycan-binding domain-containing protein n=1 Tax=Thiothrix lacustris TaxID=525917 RepID=A0ABY9MRQ0_9GAMM|nr:peptidoglycan-binding domain-containing protein [Thiothrix lacustris]WML90891.1 peptidoglycan-binding domain-containing protein [Thiothrix lacustris]